MPFSLELAYGRATLPFQFTAPPDILQVRDPDAVTDPVIFRQQLDLFLDRAPLHLTQPAVVVADKTRLCGYPQYLPVLTAALAARGAAMHRLKIFIAYGTHPRQSESASRAAYGEIYDQYRWVHHECGDTDIFQTLGRTRRGTPVRLRKDILAASSLITFGAISHHYFAGYGGGRKLIFPGLGEKEAIYTNHGLFLDRAGHCLAAGCRAGNVKGNPLAEDLAEVEAFRAADLAVHGILDSHGRVRELQVGRGEEHFQEACARHAAHCEISAGRYDLVLASCGGFPKDINFIQSHKAIHNAAALVRDGGRLIMLAQCANGVGSRTFLPWFEMRDRHAAFDRLAAHYEGNGGTALSMMAKLQRIDITVVTAMEPAVAEMVGFQHRSADQVRDMVRRYQGRMAVVPNASLLVPAVGV